MFRRVSILLTFAVLVGFAVLAQVNSPQATTNQVGVAGSTAGTLLYSQLDSPGAGGTLQDFEAAYDAYDSEGADDFDVTFPGGWSIERITNIGTQSGTGMITGGVDVVFYDNAGTLPGTPMCSYAGETSLSDTSLDITLSAPCVLPMGRHWMQLQVNQDFLTQGQYFWTGNTVQALNPGVWRNPGDGFGTGCVTYTPVSSCLAAGPDWTFALFGMDVPVELQSFQVD